MYVIWEPSEGFLNMGGGGKAGKSLLMYQVLLLIQPKSDLGGGITPCTPDSDGPVCDMGVYPCQTSVLSPITPSFAFFALFEH